MKRYCASILALLFYVSILPWPAASAQRGRFSDMILEGVPWVDVRAYMDGQSGRPTIAQWQAGALVDNVLIAATAAMTAGSKLVFPTGIYIVTPGTWTISLKSNLSFIGLGDGRGDSAVRIVAPNSGDNTATGILLEIIGSSRLYFENIQFRGNNLGTGSGNTEKPYRTTIGAYVRRGSGNVSAITFERCSFRAFGTGIQWGHLTTPESGNDALTLNDCEFSYCNDGYIQYWSNAMNNNMYGLAVTYCDNGLTFGNATQGTGKATLHDLNAGHNVNDIYLASGVDSLTLVNPRTENSQHFIASSSGGSTSVSSVNMFGGVLTATDGVEPFIRFKGNNLVAVGTTFGVAGNPIQVKVLSQANDAALTFIHCDFNGDWIAKEGLGTYNTSRTQFTVLGSRYWDGSQYQVLGDRSHTSAYGVAWLDFAANDNTPSVLHGNFYRTAATGTSAITAFDNGYLGQQITIACIDNNTSFVHNATTLILNGSANFTCTAGGTISFVYNVVEYFQWRETGRMVP